MSAQDDGFDYVAEMKDGMSKPAKEGKAALHQLGEEIKKTEAEIRKLQGMQQNYRDRGGNWKGIASNVGNEIARVRLHLGDLKKEEGEVKEKSETLFGSFMKGLIPEVAIGMAAERAGEKIAELGIEMVKFAVESAEFKENTKSAYEVLGKDGEEMFASVDRLAHQIHMPAEIAHGLTQDLLMRGLEDEKMLAATVAAIGASQRAGPAGTADKLQSIIDRSLSLGKFQLRSPRELAAAGIDVERLYADLGRRLGKGRDEIKAELKAGTIDAKEGIAAIDDAINNGKIGEIAKKKLTTGDILVDFKNNMRAMFQDVDTGPLVEGFRDLAGVFGQDTASGQTMHDTITWVLNGIIKWIKRGIEFVIDFGLNTEIAALQAYIALFPIIDVIARIVKGIGWMVDAWQKVDFGPVQAIVEIPKYMYDVGQEAIRGLAKGIGSGAPGAVDASTDVATDVMGGMTDTFEIHSPSRKTMRIGGHLDEGLALGMESGRSPDVMADMMRVPDLSSFASNAQASPGGGTVVHVDVGGIVIHAMSGDEIMPIIESQIVDVFERAALELGQ